MNVNNTEKFGNFDLSGETTECYPSVDIRVFITIILLIAVLVSVAGNFLICIIVYRKAPMRSGINLLLANLALADLLVAITNFAFTLVVLNRMTWNLGIYFCYMNGTLYNLIQSEKALILLVISVDRYFIIVNRRDTVTPYKAKVLITLTWLMAIIMSLPPVLGWGKYYFRCGDVQCVLDFRNHTSRSYIVFSTTYMVIVPSLVLLFLYYHIMKTVRKNCFRVQNHLPVTQTAMHKKGKLFIDYAYKTRTSTTILLICLVFILSMLPLGITNLEMVRSKSGYIKNCLYRTLLWISYLHGSINPIIFYFRIEKFREAVNELVPDFLNILSIFPVRTKRKIQPHVVYSVDKTETNIFINRSKLIFP